MMIRKMSGQYEVKELNGVNCAIVEDNISPERCSFLTLLLEHNGYAVQSVEKPAATEEELPTYTVGVSDITFNPSLAVYSRQLKTLDDKVLLPYYWFTGEESESWYWKEERV